MIHGDRWVVIADVLHVDEPAERWFRGEDAKPMAIGFARGLLAGNPTIVQVRVSHYDATVNAWSDYGVMVNDIYRGSLEPAGQ